MEDLEGAVRRDFRLDLLEAGDDARITNELRDNRMVRMSSVQRMGDHDLRLQTPDHDRNLRACLGRVLDSAIDRKSTRLNSSHLVISYAVFCLKKKKTI